MSRTPSTAMLIAAGGALLVAGIGWSLLSSSSAAASSKSRDLGEIDESAEDCITADEVAKVFDSLFLEMQNILAKLMQQIQAIQMTGQTIPEKQLKTLLRHEMERALLVKEKEIADAFDMDYECLEEATWEFLTREEEFPKVKRAVDRFQKLWESTTGESVVGWRRGQTAANRAAEEILPPDRLIEVAEKYFSALTECMREIVARYKTAGRSLQDPATQQALNMEFAEKANDAGEEALEREGISMSSFEASIKQHSGNPTVGRALGMMQMRQQQELMAIGQD